jgi:preprotein translocase subunit YajC
MEAREVKDLMEAYASIYANLSESHFKVGDEVVCKKSGMEGEVVKVDEKEEGKYYTVKREDGKKVKYSPNELKPAEEAKNGGAPKKKEEKFHTKLDKLVHSTFGSSPEEEKMKEDLDTVVDTVTSTVKPHIQDRARKRHGGPLGLFGGLAADRAGKEVDAIGGDVKSGNYGSALNRTIKGASKLFNSYEPDKFDIILEYLVAEGYADTNQSALAIMANMSEEWRQSIVEMTDFEAGGGNAKMKKTGMSRSEVEALGKKNIEKSEKSSATTSDSRKESRREFERKAMAAGKSPVGYQRMLDAQKREKEYMEWEKKQPKPSGGYKGLAG